MSLDQIALIAAAGLACGMINAVAGGGSLILFPALIAVGMPTLAANVTNSVATWPGYLGGAIGFRQELYRQRRRLIPLTIVTIVGSSAGCVLLLVTPASAFDAVVPGLVLAASLLLAFQPRISRLVGTPTESNGRLRAVTLAAVLVAMIYGGYFGGALGIVVIGALALTLAGSLRQLNALKGGLTLVDASVSVVIFGLFGPVDWLVVAIAAPTALLGGYLGALVAQRLNDQVLRRCVVVFGIGVAVYLFLR